MSRHRTLLAAFLVLSALSLPVLSDAAAPLKGGAFTAAQAATGKIAVESFIKTGYVPPLVGEEFLTKWKGKTVVQLAENLGSAGKSFRLPAWMKRRYLEIAAYVLQMNGIPAGDQELTPSSTVMVDAVVGMRSGTAP